MSAKWIKVNDLVCVISGKCKGQRGKVLAKRGNKVLVEGLNKKKKSLKKNESNPNGGFSSVESAIHISNVAICDEFGSKLKLKVKILGNGKKMLVYSKDGLESIFRTISKGKEVLDVGS